MAKLTSKKREKRLAKETSQKRKLASGAFFHNKGDLGNEYYLSESKGTEKKSISVRQDWLIKIAKEAFPDKEPLLILTFENLESPFCQKDWIAMQLDEFNRLQALCKSVK